MDFRQSSAEPSEIVLGVIGPMGANKKLVVETMSKLASHYSYGAEPIVVSDLIKQSVTLPDPKGDQYKRVTNLIDAGNQLRLQTNDNSILAKMAATKISTLRQTAESRKTIYIIDSIKHPEEVEELRDIYGDGFYLFAVHSSQKTREAFLEKQCLITEKSKRDELIERDQDEHLGYGQSTRDAFHLADFFLTENGNSNKVWAALERFFDLIFGHPFRTPTFNEFAMFMAHSAAMRSADMSRQVGAVISIGNDIVSTGANECPKPHGGTYWPLFDEKTNIISDTPDGRDYMRGEDRNAKEKQSIIDALKTGIPPEVIALLDANIAKSGIKDITEYGRVVHAEMDAILGCARRGVSCDHAVIFVTTFPCHNCAKHIISSGVKEVIYIEPYPKSKALDMHPDAISAPDKRESNKVLFTPFVGVGPRQFVNLFSLNLSVGEKIGRKQSKSHLPIKWENKNARPRVKMFPRTYIDNEKTVTVESMNSLANVQPICIK